MNQVALITGITGQDGSYLAELLLSKGYEVHGVMRRSSSFNTGRIDHILPELHLHFGDLCDASSLARIVRLVEPTEVYNLGGQSHVKVSFEAPIYTAETVAMGTLNLLEAVRQHQDEGGRPVRFYQASSSEQFGNSRAINTLMNEATSFRPCSPYAVAKVMAHQAVVNYRESYGLHASCGILFNHESPRRGETFVTRKITRAVGRIKMGLQSRLWLGALAPMRDWGFAGDYVQAMWMMLQQTKPGDFVIATGNAISVGEFAHRAFDAAGLDADDFIAFDPKYTRPAEVHYLLGDSFKATTIMGWEMSTSVDKLIEMMVQHDLELARREKLVTA